MIGKLTADEIESVLKNNVLGRIGCHDAARTYVVPISYAYDGHSLIAHSVEGMKIRMMRKNPDVCFEVDEMKDFNNWKSVIAWGRYQELKDVSERKLAMNAFVQRMFHLDISETAVTPEFAEMHGHSGPAGISSPIIFRIELTEKSGRFESLNAG